MNSEPEEDPFVSIGDYNPPDSRRLLAALAQARIEFRAEFFDGIKPGSGGSGGGNNAKISVRVDGDKMKQVRQILSELFGDMFESET